MDEVLSRKKSGQFEGKIWRYQMPPAEALPGDCVALPVSKESGTARTRKSKPTAPPSLAGSCAYQQIPSVLPSPHRLSRSRPLCCLRRPRSHSFRPVSSALPPVLAQVFTSPPVPEPLKLGVDDMTALTEAM